MFIGGNGQWYMFFKPICQHPIAEDYGLHRIVCSLSLCERQSPFRSYTTNGVLECDKNELGKMYIILRFLLDDDVRCLLFVSALIRCSSQRSMAERNMVGSKYCDYGKYTAIFRLVRTKFNTWQSR